jgi:hypothetical protein
VGVLRKPVEPAYQPFRTYEIVDPGKWTVHAEPRQIEFVHELDAYVYRKTVSLAEGLVIEHRLTNTGRRPIETEQYNHNFFVIDGHHVGPGVSIAFPFEPRPTMELKGLAEIRANRLVFLRDVLPDEFIWTLLEGYGAQAKDYDLRIENRDAGAGVRIVGDRPLSKLAFWSIRTVACPEPYVQLSIDPGQEERWRLSYTFYDLARCPQNRDCLRCPKAVSAAVDTAGCPRFCPAATIDVPSAYPTRLFAIVANCMLLVPS